MDRSSSSESQPQQQPASKRLRLACDSCHRVKTRCSGGNPCEKCKTSNNECTYSYMAKLGKPKGTRNKKTLERLNKMALNSTEPVNTSESQPARGRSVVPEQETVNPIVTPTSITQWMNWPVLSSTCSGLDYDLDMCLEMQSMQSTFGLDASLHSIDGGLYQVLTPIPSESRRLPDSHHLSPGSCNVSDISSPENEKVRSEPSHSATTTLQHPLVSKDATPHPTTKESNGVKNRMSQTHAPSNSDEDEGEPRVCECLRTLTGQLCVLNAMERKYIRLALDTIFSKTSKILDRATSVLSCQQCWLDSKVLLLIMTLLQTVFNWAMQEQQHCGENPNTPSVVFGKWKVSEEESDMVRAMLVNRVLIRTSSTTEMLRQRVNHISRMANDKRVRYQTMDAGTLEFTLQRLIFSVKEVVHRVKAKSQPSSSA